MENYKRIDLDLHSRTLWADRNVGAKSDIDIGLYYLWGKDDGRDFIDLEFPDELDKREPILEAPIPNMEEDVTKKLMGSEWSFPSKEQIEELI